MILAGDCLEILPTLEAESVQCVVTSPPYYGLRDYGTATWEGGDPGCDHIDEVAAAEQRRNRKGLANNADENDGATRSREVQNGIDKAFQYKISCPKCGATRIDSQIGLEATPEAYFDFRHFRLSRKPESAERQKEKDGKRTARPSVSGRAGE